MESSPFELLEPANVTIAGAPSTDMPSAPPQDARSGDSVVSWSSRRTSSIRYLVVRASGLLGKTTLIPFSAARVDLEERAIEVDVDDRDLWILRNLTPDQLLPA